MSNSFMSFVVQPQPPEHDGLLSADPSRRAVELDFVKRLVQLLSVTSGGLPAARVHEIVDALDSGRIDRAIEQFAPDTAPATPQRFDEVVEFDYDSWQRRRRG